MEATNHEQRKALHDTESKAPPAVGGGKQLPNYVPLSFWSHVLIK